MSMKRQKSKLSLAKETVNTECLTRALRGSGGEKEKVKYL